MGPGREMEMNRTWQNTAEKAGYGYQCSVMRNMELLRTLSAKEDGQCSCGNRLVRRVLETECSNWVAQKSAQE